MKAYVIKNKEEKYWQWTYNDESEFLGEIYNAFMEYSKTRAEKDIVDWQLKDCTIVPITICEGDLEEENRVLKKALELACEDISLYEDITTPKYKVKCYIQQAKESEDVKNKRQCRFERT